MIEYCALECKNGYEKGFNMHRSLPVYIERTYGKDLLRYENKSKFNPFRLSFSDPESIFCYGP